MGVIERCSEVPQASNFIKNRLWHRCFPVNFVKFIRAPFLTEHFWWLLLFTAKFALLICQGFNSVCTISLVLHHLHEFYFFPYNFYLFLDVPVLRHIQKDFGSLLSTFSQGNLTNFF